MIETALGAVASSHDYRDEYVASAIAPGVPITLPDTFHTPLPIFMQAKEPACVAHSVVELMMLYWFKKTGKWVVLSPRFLDILAKRFDGQPIDGGTIPRLVLKLATQYGCATEDVLPNDTSLPIEEYRSDAALTPAVMANALQYRIPGYVRVGMDTQSTREAIYLYGAVTSLFEIGAEFYTAPNGQTSWADKDIDPLRIPAQIVSGHQLTDNGFVPVLNNAHNHWSQAWANNGEAKYDPVAWAPYILERWAVAEIPKDIIDYLKDLPAPADFHHQWNVNLTIGMRGDEVKYLQIALLILGFLTPFPADELGFYGPKTATAVGKYQQAHRINPAPNNVGPQTRADLNAEFAV